MHWLLSGYIWLCIKRSSLAVHVQAL